MLASKKLSLALVMLSMISATGSVHAQAEANATPQDNKERTMVVVRKIEAKKRHVSQLRMFWNGCKLGFGNIVFGAGIGLLPVSIATLCGVGIVEDAPPAILIGAGLVSPLLIYGGYKIMQSGFDGTRDEYVESYFNITDPTQMKYHGE